MATRTNLKTKKAKVGSVIALGGAVVGADALASSFDLSKSPLLDAAFKLLEAGQEEMLLAQSQQTPTAVAAEVSAELSADKTADAQQAQQLAPQQTIKSAAPDVFLAGEAPPLPELPGAAQALEAPQLMAQLTTPAPVTGAEGAAGAGAAGAEAAGAAAAEAAGAAGAGSGAGAAAAAAVEASALLPAAGGLGTLGSLGVLAGGAVIANEATAGTTTTGSDLNDDDVVQGLSLGAVKISIVGQASDKDSATGPEDANKLISAGSKFFDTNIW